MRVFYAVEFSNQIKQSIKRVQQSIQKLCLSGNFSHEENFHLTLRFIGEADRKSVEELKVCLHKAAESAEPFALNFSKVGWFDRGEKKIVWIGIKNEDGGLDRLYRSLEYTLSEKGYESMEKDYSPHITLSRETIFRENADLEVRKINVYSEAIKIDRVSLMESTRINGKLTYRPIYVTELKSQPY